MESLTELQKKKIENKINNYIKRLETKKKNNEAYYNERKLKCIHCECCNKDIDKYFYKKHLLTAKHIANANQTQA